MSGVFYPTEAAPTPAPAAPAPMAQPALPSPQQDQQPSNPVDLILGDMGRVSDGQMRGEAPPPADMAGFGQQQPDGQQQPQQPQQQQPGPQQPPPPPPGFVPLRAVQEEREARRELQGQVQTMQQMLMGLMQRVPQPDGQQPAAPDPNTDPVGFIQSRLQGLETHLQTLQQTQAHVQEQARRQQEEAQFAQAYQAQARAYMQQDPSFSDAYIYFREKLVAGHEEVLGDRAAAERAADQQERQIASFAMQQGRNPAQTVRGVAARWGWQPGAGQSLMQARQQPQAPQAPQGWPQQPQPGMGGPQPLVPNHGAVPPEYRNPWPQGFQQAPQATAWQPQPDAAFQAIQNGQQATRSLNGGVPGTPGEPSLQHLAQMSLDDFARIPPGQWARLMGGA